MIELLTSPDAWLSLVMLTTLEVVLGIDNIVFLTILTGRLPQEQRLLGRRLGLMGALGTRILLLFALSWLAHLDETLFTLWRPWSGHDLVLVSGGLFLLWKATKEIYENVEHPQDEEQAQEAVSRRGLVAIIVQIALLDVVFSLDSVITAVGVVEHLPIMVAAVLLAVMVMMLFAGPVGDFVQNNPSVRILALSFLVLIGATLIMEGTGEHVPKPYVYSAMGFSILVQTLNLRRDKRLEQARD
ncbi:MAG: TerC family protein [Alphaproteobacteria bacterium]|nr:TerC family protein [Alphaproteobacteria bacterium]MCB9698228.1 TerC family protein [Alphaproteobacteria bacterium]